MRNECLGRNPAANSGEVCFKPLFGAAWGSFSGTTINGVRICGYKRCPNLFGWIFYRLDSHRSDTYKMAVEHQIDMNTSPSNQSLRRQWRVTDPTPPWLRL